MAEIAIHVLLQEVLAAIKENKSFILVTFSNDSGSFMSGVRKEHVHKIPDAVATLNGGLAELACKVHGIEMEESR